MAIHPNDISLIIPVKDNQKGINDFFNAFFETHTPEEYPLELIVVDNNSTPAITLPALPKKDGGLTVKLLNCSKLGPACARNKGAFEASGKWLLFIDSDCVPTTSLIEAYCQCKKEGVVAYAGSVNALGKDNVSQYYQSQQIHYAPAIIDKNGERKPKCLVAANILVLKKVFHQINGFNEAFEFGGEDIDFGLRLAKEGDLAYAPNAIVLHNYDDGFRGFIRRFYAYGIGNRLVEQYHDIHLIPLPFTAKNKKVVVNHFLALIQWGCLLCGYLKTDMLLRIKVLKK